MDKKKLTDEEIVKALDFCYNSPCCGSGCPYFNKDGRNFCVEDKALYKDVKRIVLEHAEQKAEIERLTERCKGNSEQYELGFKCAEEMFNSRIDYCIHIESQNRELQKQVDELKEENGKLVTIGNGFALERNNLREELDELKKQFLSSCENCHLKKDIELLRYQKEQAVKDTAKEICDLILEHWEKKQFVECDWLRVTISERYGVEVE